MELTDGERLIAIMLSEVMEALKLNKEVDPSLIKTLLCNGDDWAIARKYSGIFSSEARNPDHISETTDILWMWGIIEHSIGSLKDQEAAEAQGWHWTKFVGFDGNNDPHFGIAHTMINNLDEFQDFKNRGLNSHSQATLPRYRDIYTKFYKYVQSGDAAPLSFSALQDICS